MKPLFRTVLAFAVLTASCRENAGSASAEKADSLSRARQRAASDSLKRSNPLLIAPPDSSYTGSYVDKYDNGITKFTGFFRQGKRHGQWLSFYPDGEIWSEMHYDKGLRHGPNVAYHENGEKRYEGVYMNDLQDSIWSYYDTSGKLARKVLFDKNRLVEELPVR